MVVEKIDLKTLFLPVCEKYHIPIASSGGWSSMLQRAIYAKRFQQAQDRGLTCVLLYCGDHDPDGLRISDFLRKNLADLKDVEWEDGSPGYDPEDLEIVRFGINNDFITKNKLTWIDNLITGSKRGLDLADPRHKNHRMPYVQAYLSEYGAKKCEANALMTIPKEAEWLVEEAIINFVGEDASKRFEKKRKAVNKIVEDFREKTGMTETLQKALDLIEEEGV